MIVQIYEIQTPSEARLMVDLGVDHIGSVMLTPAERQDDLLKSTVDLVRNAGRRSSLIPLFDDIDHISLSVNFYQPDILHFCEALPTAEDDPYLLEKIVERQKAIRKRFSQIEIMRSIPIAAKDHSQLVPSLSLAAAFEPFSDWFLTDTFLTSSKEEGHCQPVIGYVGITGQPCDWDVCRQLVTDSRIPVILAGGIGPDNVAQGIDAVRPAGVDSCTRTNAVDRLGCPIRFRKDPDKVRSMIDIARSKTVRTDKTN